MRGSRHVDFPNHDRRICPDFVGGRSGQAAQIAYEGFNYQPPAVASGTALGSITPAGGTGWSDATWLFNNNGFPTNPTGGLSYGALATQAGAVTDPSASNNQSYIRKSSASLMTGTAVRWFSLLLDIDSLSATPTANARAVWAGLSNDNANATSVSTNVGFSVIGNNAGNGYDMVARIGANDGTEIALTLGSPILIVGKYSLNAVGNEFMEVWLNPATSTLGGADLTSGSSAGGYSSLSASSTINGASFAFNAAGALGNTFTGTLDEIRVGDTYADVTPVIPEPASMTLLAVGGLMMLRRRRGA